MQTDPLADFLTTIRNAARASKSEIRVPWSRMRSDVAHVLKNEGYVLEVEKVSDKEAKAGKPELRDVYKRQRKGKLWIRIFPEVELDKVKRNLGMDITIVTTARKNEEAKELLALFGMPFSDRKLTPQ